MNYMLKRISIVLVALFSLALIAGCLEKSENEEVNQEFYELMNNYYFWYDKMPEVKPENYPTPEALLEALRYKQLDKWSFISTKQEINSYYNDAEYVGFGFGMAFDTSYRLWVSFVFSDSPMRAVGVDRGWQISHINGIVPTPTNTSNLLSPTTLNFTFINSQGQSVSHSISKRTVKMNTVLMNTIYETSAGKVGYFVLKGFVGPTVVELNTVFNDFSAASITDLIIDLRYNGGGSVDVASHLANLIVGGNVVGQDFGRYIHNDKLTQQNRAIVFKALSNSLNLQRIIYITSRNSASASELVINGLFPHIDVVLVGDRTYGKPVGMYGLESDISDLIYFPICFKIVNSNNQGDFYDGIPVDIPANDGINYPFGHLSEPCLAAAIAFIEGGKSKASPAEINNLKYPLKTGLQEEIGAW
jgi:C-terminal processing protease CtpA/Prc